MTDLVYVYAILAGDVARTEQIGQWGLVGIEQASVRAVAEGPLAAAVSDVPASEFDEGPLNERIGDLDWLGPRAVAHQEVNARLFQRVDALLPLSFGTVFRDEARVKQLLRDQRDDLLVRLDRVRGRGEWVLTIHRDEATALVALEQSDEAVRALRQEVAASSPGRAYLLNRRLDAARRQGLVRLDAEATHEILTSLGPKADDLYRESLPQRTTEGPIARASVLVSRSAEPAFLETLEATHQRWDARGYSVAATGPWPPYRFGSLQPEGAHAAG